MIPAETLKESDDIPIVMREFDEYAEFAGKYLYEYGFRKAMEKRHMPFGIVIFKMHPNISYIGTCTEGSC